MGNERLAEIVRGFSGKRVAVVGDVCLDRYIFGTVERLNPENEAAVLMRVTGREYRLGCAGNDAVALAALGAKVSLFSIFGEDEKNVFSDLCRKWGIGTYGNYEGSTLIKNRLISKPRDHYLMRFDDGEEAELKPITSASEERIFSFLKDHFEGSAIVLADYNKSVFRRGLGRLIIDYAGSKGILTVADFKPKNAAQFYGATAITPNLSEAIRITGINGPLEEIASKLRKEMDAKYAVVTLSENGIITYDGEDYFQALPRAKKVIDPVGAGDTISSVLALSLASGANITEAAQIANYAAGLVVEKRGTAFATQDELVTRILEN